MAAVASSSIGTDNQVEMSTPSTSRLQQGAASKPRTRQQVRRSQAGQQPSGVQGGKIVKKSHSGAPTLADTLGNAQKDSVWPAPDPKISGDDRVFRQLMAAEETTTPLRGYCASVQREVQPYMRKIVICWMFDVCTDTNVDMDVFPLAVNYLDRFLSCEQIYQDQLQALATACMWLASKVKSPDPMKSQELCNYTDSAVAMGPLMSWELLVLGRLNWEVAAITLVDYLEPLLHRMQLPFERANQVRVAFRCLIPKIAYEYELSSYAASMQACVCLSIAVQYTMRQHVDNVLQHDQLLRITHQVIFAMLKVSESTMLSFAQDTYARMTATPLPKENAMTNPSQTTVSSLATPPHSPDSAYGSEAYCTPSPTAEQQPPIGKRRVR